MPISVLDKRVLQEKLLDKQGWSIESRKEKRDDDGLGVKLHNTSVKNVIDIVEWLLEDYELVEIE